MPNDYKRMGILRDGKKLFTVVFSWSKMMLFWSKRMVSFRKVHWVFFLSLQLRSLLEKKTEWTFLQDTILLLQDNIILLQEKTTVKSFLPSRSSSSLYNHEANNTDVCHLTALKNFILSRISQQFHDEILKQMPFNCVNVSSYPESKRKFWKYLHLTWKIKAEKQKKAGKNRWLFCQQTEHQPFWALKGLRSQWNFLRW